MIYALLNQGKIVEAVSERPFSDGDVEAIEVDWDVEKIEQLLGRRVVSKGIAKLKIAIIVNWNDKCGISTYTKFLTDCLRPKVKEIKIFSESRGDTCDDVKDNVVRCWARGQSMAKAVKALKEWGADFIIVQHEFGIFPVATHFLKFMEDIASIPYVVVLHSTYLNHLDKTVCTAVINNIMVHSHAAKNVLIELGHDEKAISVVPHGCISFGDVKPLWNTFQTPYAIMQFGFGFNYKGVDRAIEAIAHLKRTDAKFKNIFYTYLCSTTGNMKGAQSEYYKFLKKKVKELDVEDNVVIILKFHSEKIINNFLRTAKLALFPYITDPNNTVFGATGALRVAMANGIPVIGSESHLFDDLQDVIPRPDGALPLAREIDKIFSDGKYRDKLLEGNKKYIRENTWEITANRYIEVMENIITSESFVKL